MFHNLHIAGVIYDSLVDGHGVRTAIYFSGCAHNCPGCHNPETHDPNYGKLVTYDDVTHIANEINKRPYIQGITLTGGDPLFTHDDVLDFIALLRAHVNKKLDVWLYTGSRYEDIKNVPLIQYGHIDVLVDGPYIESLRDPSLAFRGSSNQRIIDVQASLKAGEVVLYDLKGTNS